jgi:hypothetical protein
MLIEALPMMGNLRRSFTNLAILSLITAGLLSSAPIEAQQDGVPSPIVGKADATAGGGLSFETKIQKVQETLTLGPPAGVSNLIATFNKQKPYRIGYTKLVQSLLADSIVRQNPANNTGQTLTASALNPVLDKISEADVKKMLDDRLPSLTGLVVPPADVLQKHITNQNAIADQTLKLNPQTLQLGAGPNDPTPGLTSFNWTQPGFSLCNSGIVTAVQDQTKPINCGCCWAFATVGAFEAAYAKKNCLYIGASEQYLLNFGPSILKPLNNPPGQSWDCNGGWWAFDLLVAGSGAKVNNPGLPSRANLSYQGVPQAPSSVSHPYMASAWGYVGSSADIPTPDELKSALCKYGPLVVAVTANTAWFFNSGDVLDDFPNDIVGQRLNHAVVLIGWDNGKGAWLFKNSWGTGCGIQVNGSGTGFMYNKYGSNNFGYSAAWVIAQ